MKQITKEQIANSFQKSIENTFTNFLLGFGFKHISSSSGEDSFSVEYRRKKCHIRIGGSLHPLDSPFFYYLSLEERKDKLSRSERDSIALWRIIKSKPEHGKEKLYTEDLFKIPIDITERQIEEKIRLVKKLCEVYCTDFLNNDLTELRDILVSVNKAKDAYTKAHSPGAKGGHKTTYEKISAKLKKWFSKWFG